MVKQLLNAKVYYCDTMQCHLKIVISEAHNYIEMLSYANPPECLSKQWWLVAM